MLLMTLMVVSPCKMYWIVFENMFIWIRGYLAGLQWLSESNFRHQKWINIFCSLSPHTVCRILDKFGWEGPKDSLIDIVNEECLILRWKKWLSLGQYSILFCQCSFAPLNCWTETYDNSLANAPFVRKARGGSGGNPQRSQSISGMRTRLLSQARHM